MWWSRSRLPVLGCGRLGQAGTWPRAAAPSLLCGACNTNSDYRPDYHCTINQIPFHIRSRTHLTISVVVTARSSNIVDTQKDNHA
jgi:hypothetical protein